MCMVGGGGTKRCKDKKDVAKQFMTSLEVLQLCTGCMTKERITAPIIIQKGCKSHSETLAYLPTCLKQKAGQNC